MDYPIKASKSFLESGLPELSIHDYEYVKHLGDGAWGSVFQYRSIADNKLVALKFFGMRHLECSTQPITYLIEAEILREWNLTQTKAVNGIPKVHGYIVDSYDGYAAGHVRINPRMNPYEPHHISGKKWKGRHLIKVTECCDKDVMNVLVDGKSFSSGQVCRIFKSIIMALRELHENDMIHRDIKLENMCFRDNSYMLPDEVMDDIVVKLIDLGNAVVLNGKEEFSCESQLLAGTSMYRAPETQLRNVHSKATDVWSAGICLWILALRNMPNALSFRQSKAPKYLHDSPVIPDGLQTLFSRIFDHNPISRITIDEILVDPWFLENSRPLVAISHEMAVSTDDIAIMEEADISINEYDYSPLALILPPHMLTENTTHEEQFALTVYQSEQQQQQQQQQQQPSTVEMSSNNAVLRIFGEANAIEHSLSYVLARNAINKTAIENIYYYKNYDSNETSHHQMVRVPSYKSYLINVPELLKYIADSLKEVVVGNRKSTGRKHTSKMRSSDTPSRNAVGLCRKLNPPHRNADVARRQSILADISLATSIVSPTSVAENRTLSVINNFQKMRSFDDDDLNCE